MSLYKQALINLINDRKVVKTEAVTTAGGTQTTTYLDIPAVLGDAKALDVGTRALTVHLVQHKLLNEVTMIVGPMTGSIPLVMGLVAQSDDLKWSIIRDEVKDHGLQRGFVGAEPGPGDKVILVDDVASSGKSLLEAYDQIRQTGAEVMAVVPLVDRGERAWPKFIGVRYLPVLTYQDLGIEAL